MKSAATSIYTCVLFDGLAGIFVFEPSFILVEEFFLFLPPPAVHQSRGQTLVYH